jgi:predicted O-linked N-acetylglucosamine transferase (SPINDLY family)
VTFGIFQRPAKFHGAFWDTVAQVLANYPRSTLLIQYESNEMDLEESTPRKEYLAIFSSRGIEKNRIRFRGPVPMEENLEFFAGVDIALDTFPYNGQTTTCECLWMGVPVVTLAGAYHVARVGHSILSRAGLPDLVARDHCEYVRLATGLAVDRDRLRELRWDLRSRMRTSSLMNGQSVAGIEHEYRRMWRAWCGDPLRKDR